jgi:hypothetical protein
MNNKAIEEHKIAAKHHEEAAKYHNDAVKHHEDGNQEEAFESNRKAVVESWDASEAEREYAERIALINAHNQLVSHIFI